jgi:hypothetical protein
MSMRGGDFGAMTEGDIGYSECARSPAHISDELTGSACLIAKKTSSSVYLALQEPEKHHTPILKGTRKTEVTSFPW